MRSGHIGVAFNCSLSRRSGPWSRVDPARRLDVFTDRSSSPTSTGLSQAPHARPRPSSTWSPPGLHELALPPPTVSAGLAPSQGASDRTAGKSSPDSLFGLSFGSRNRAQQFLLAIMGLAQDSKLRLVDAVMVVKDDHNHARVRASITPRAARRALSTAMWTGLVGLLIGGPIGWIVGAGVGAGVGALIAKVLVRGVPNEWVAWFKDAVRPDTTTVVVLAGNIDQRALGAELDRFPGVRLVHTTPGIEAFSQLRSAFNDRVPTKSQEQDPT